MEVFVTPCCEVPLDFRVFNPSNPAARIVCPACKQACAQHDTHTVTLGYNDAIFLIKKHYPDDGDMLIEAYKRTQNDAKEPSVSSSGTGSMGGGMMGGMMGGVGSQANTGINQTPPGYVIDCYGRMRKVGGNKKTRFILLALFLIPVLLIAVFCFNEQEYVVTVLAKENKVTLLAGSGRNAYLNLVHVQTQEGVKRKFKCENILMRVYFDSADVYGSLQVGETYKVTVVGWEFPLFRAYKNIVKVEQLS